MEHTRRSNSVKDAKYGSVKEAEELPPPPPPPPPVFTVNFNLRLIFTADLTTDIFPPSLGDRHSSLGGIIRNKKNTSNNNNHSLISFFSIFIVTSKTEY
jgi:hypothetical protein